MPSYEFAKEILPNIWIGTIPALTDAEFRSKHHIIRDIIIVSSFSTDIKPKLVSQSAKVWKEIMNGDENSVQIKTICNKLFPVIDTCFKNDQGLLISGESWNSPHIKLVCMWCSQHSSLTIAQIHSKIMSLIQT
jgi:hypothetical protein